MEHLTADLEVGCLNLIRGEALFWPQSVTGHEYWTTADFSVTAISNLMVNVLLGSWVFNVFIFSSHLLKQSYFHQTNLENILNKICLFCICSVNYWLFISTLFAFRIFLSFQVCDKWKLNTEETKYMYYCKPRNFRGYYILHFLYWC